MASVVPIRSATPARWRAALRRAFDEGVQLRQLSGSGQWVATSGTRTSVAYETDGVSCTCEAAMFAADPVCKHRALYWHRQGLLDPEDPTPPTPPAVATRFSNLPGEVRRTLAELRPFEMTMRQIEDAMQAITEGAVLDDDGRLSGLSDDELERLDQLGRELGRRIDHEAWDAARLVDAA